MADRVFRLITCLHYGVWLMILVAFVTTSAIIYLIGRLSPCGWKRLADKGEASFREGKSLNLRNSPWLVFSTLMWQGYEISPRAISARVVIAFWWIFVIMTVLTYTASLTQQFILPLADESPDTSIRDIDDLVSRKDIQYGAISNGATQAFFQSSTIGLYAKMWQHMTASDAPVFVRNTMDGLHKVRQSDGKYAFFMEGATAKYVINKRPCDLVQVGNVLAHRSNAFAVQKSSPLVHTLNDILIRMEETGDLELFRNKWFPKQCDKEATPQQLPPMGMLGKFEPVSLLDFAAAPIILSVGILLGLTILFLELAFCRPRKSKLLSSPTEIHDKPVNLDDEV